MFWRKTQPWSQQLSTAVGSLNAQSQELVKTVAVFKLP